MKKLISMLFVLTFLFCAIKGTAQSKSGSEYFVGKWNVLVKGTPDGDSKLTISLEKADSLLAGAVLDSTGTEMAKFSKVELNKDQVTLSFTTRGYDVTMVLAKKDDDHVTGSVMGRFEAEGDRVKTPK